MNACPFCDPETLEIETMLENRFCRFLQQPDKVLSGAGVIIPKRHCETRYEMDLDEWDAMQDLLNQVKAFITTSHKPLGYTIGWNCGAVSGVIIHHVHMHVIPRLTNEPIKEQIQFSLKPTTADRFGN